MSLLQCDQCKNMLKDPIFIPCGYSICKRHIDESTSHITPCRFCNKVHQDPFVANQKVSRLLDILNRTKDSLTDLSDKTQVYEKLKQNPPDFVNSRFDDLKRRVEEERDKIVEFVRFQVDLETEKCVSEIENHRERCLNRLDVTINDEFDFTIDRSYINAKSAKINEFFVSNKISEHIWDEIYHETNLMYEKVTTKIADLQESYMDKCFYRFEPMFDYAKKIDFGRLIVEQAKANGDQIETIICIDSPQQQQTAAQINSESLTLPNSPIETVRQIGMNFARKSTYKRRNGSKNDSDANKSQPIRKARRFKRTLGHTSFVYCICFDRSGEYIFTGSDDKLVKMWRAKDGMLVYTLRGHTKEISDLDINYENTILASGAYDKKVMCWNVKTAQLIYINTHILSVSTVNFSPYCQDNNRWLISTGNDGLLFFLKYTHNPNSSSAYDFDKPVRFQVDSKIFCSSFSTGGNFLAIGTKEKQIYVYYILKTHPIFISKFPGHDLEVNSINFSNRSLSFLSGSNDETAKVWEIKENKWTSSLVIKFESYCTEAVWNCDDSLLITAQRANKRVENPLIKIWTPSGDLKHVLKFHKRIIFNIKPHPTDPKLLLSASLDGYVVLWDIFTGQRLFTDYNDIGCEDIDEGICNAKWSPKNAELFASSDSNGHLSIFGFGRSIPESYSSTPSQLFFHTDYDPLCKCKDHVNTIVDKRTKTAPNFMPYGYLTDCMLNPLPLKAQRLVATHENLTEEEFEKMLLVPEPIDFVSDNLTHKNLIQPLSETLLKESETVRLEFSAKEDEVFNSEFSHLLKDVEMNGKKRRERFDSSSSTLDSISKPSKRKDIY